MSLNDSPQRLLYPIAIDLSLNHKARHNTKLTKFAVRKRLLRIPNLSLLRG
jgi:hypothetical protein